jgi:hypothetical protein
MKHNYVAKHMNSFNRASVVPDKRDKDLDDLFQQELEEELNAEEDQE